MLSHQGKRRSVTRLRNEALTMRDIKGKETKLWFRGYDGEGLRDQKVET